MPSLCLRPYQNPHHKLQTILSCGLNTSSPNLCSPQPRGEAVPRSGSSPRSTSRPLPRASSTPQLDLDSSSLSSGSSGDGDARLAWKPDLSRSLPEVEQSRSSPAPSRGSKSPSLRNRNDSGFVESSAAELGSSLADPEVAAAVPKVPARPSAQEILQRCSTVTKRAVQQQSALRPHLPIPGRQ